MVTTRRGSSSSSSSTVSSFTSRRSSSSLKRSRRGCVAELAGLLVDGRKTVIITGAGLSVASGVRPFRGNGGVWTATLWEKNTRSAFRKDPLEWYNTFWLPQFVSSKESYPNEGHWAIDEILEMCPEVSLITQNIDGLHGHERDIIEAHGRLGFYKCIPEEDSDTDSDSDEDDDRLVHLGHRRKSRALKRAYSRSTACSDSSNTSTHTPCRYEWNESIALDKIEPASVRQVLQGTSNASLETCPRCPSCRKPCAPQALLFDEGYHSHSHYRFEQMEALLGECEVLVFVGTSFHVRLTQIALEHARACSLRVYNFNTSDVLAPTFRLNVQNVVGPAEDTLPRLVEACREIKRENRR